jgi:hypothetical protein
MLILNVYMPINDDDDGDDDASLEFYHKCLGKLHAYVLDTDAVLATIKAGDFNCSSGSRFYDELGLANFATDNNFVLADCDLRS